MVEVQVRVEELPAATEEGLAVIAAAGIRGGSELADEPPPPPPQEASTQQAPIMRIEIGKRSGNGAGGAPPW